MLPIERPAERLVGVLLPGGWRVLRKIEKDSDSTGGFFSTPYIVESKDGKQAFLKAIDYSGALKSPDPAQVLHEITEAFLFEKAVLIKCKEKRLDKVVIAITDGLYTFGSGEPVQYLIFELAESDVRHQILLNDKFDVAWKLRSLHHIAIGLEELHKIQIAHQDLKPSNVLVFPDKISKIADFGRSAYKGHNSPHENLKIPGDYGYAPPEQLYGFLESDWQTKCFSCDAYHLGSMVIFFFSGVQMTALLRAELSEDLWWKKWGGTYDEILPALIDAFYRVLENFEKGLPAYLKGELVEIVGQLCHPDSRKRGNIQSSNASGQFSLEVYISKFDRLARRAELKIAE